MKLKLLFWIFIAVAISLSSACKKDAYVDRRLEEIKVKTVVYSNTPGAVITVNGVSSKILTIKERLEIEVMTASYFGQTIVRCDDPNVLITVEKYVWGKLKAKKSGNGRVEVNVVYKKDRRRY